MNSCLVRQRKAVDLRAKNFPGGDDEWLNILRHILNPQSASSLSEERERDLEVAASIHGGKVTITIRRRIDKIAQRLGSVELAQDDDAEIHLFEWCGSAIDQKSILESEQSDLRSKYESAQVEIASLGAKLEELVKAKADHEEELISKFVLLLNEKKLKIRNQQRLLSTAKLDQKKLQEMQNTLEGVGRRAATSRGRKRRAEAQTGESETLNDSSDAFERMEVDQQEGIVAGSQEPSSERQTTPETETDPDTEGAAADSVRQTSPVPGAARTKRIKAPKKTNASSAAKPANSRQTRTKTASPPPPVRQLPFAKRGARAKRAPEPEPEPEQEPVKQAKSDTQDTVKEQHSDDESTTDDDEL